MWGDATIARKDTVTVGVYPTLNQLNTERKTMSTTTYGKNKSVPYSNERGTISGERRYLTDATDKGATWIENDGTCWSTVLTLRNHQQSWYFTETKTLMKDGVNVLLRANIRRNAYDEQSEIRYEFWNGSKWEAKHVIGIEGTPVEHISYTTPLYKLDTEAFRTTADIVWEFARAYGDL